MVYAVKTIICQNCGEKMTGRYPAKRKFCNVACRQTYLNHPDRNPAKRPEVKRKISEAMQGHQRCVGRVLSTETKERISKALTGKKQTPKHIANRVQGIKRARQKRGGFTPAQKRQIEALHKSGPDHPNWRGGTTPHRTANYFNDARYEPFRFAVLNRDKKRCQDCSSNLKLRVHHIMPYAECPERAFDVDNGLTLCEKCHRARHRGQSRPGG